LGRELAARTYKIAALSLGERVVRQLTDSEPGEGSFLFE
jgi:hypothetical protein